MSFRKEKKYKLTIFEFNNLKKLLIKKGMQKIYNKRFINSLYYDTKQRDMFYHSEEGVMPRKKIRIRWYNSEMNFKIEKKISSIDGRYKITNNLPIDKIENFPKNISDQLYGLLTPSLRVSYEREYFYLSGMRITFDTSIKYQNYRYFSLNDFNDPESVVEIKVSMDTSDDFIESLIPYPTTRFSKYSRGLLISQINI
jgi:SPX domain protein involved in polyphosphate accumulation